jgi:hypothetical protein
MKTKAAVIVACVLAALWARAAAGPAERVACDPAEAFGRQSCYAYVQHFDKPAEGAGVVNARAVIVKFTPPRGPALTIAIDSDKPGAGANLLRFDFTGKGQFRDAPTVPLVAGPWQLGSTEMKFGPKTVEARTASGVVPIRLEGRYYRSGTYRLFVLDLSSAAQATCRFGEKSYTVRIVDGNNDLRYGAPWRAPRSTRNRTFSTGDTVIVEAGAGEGSKGVRTACYGSPVEVGGAWYDVRVSEDGKSISAEPVDLAAGRVRINQHKWACLLIGRKHAIRLTGGREPVAVPADDYVLTRFEQWSKPKAGQAPARVERSDYSRGKTDKELHLTVRAGKTAEVAVGSPLSARIEVNRRSGRTYSLGMSLTDVSGSDVGGLTMPNGKPPSPPKVTIRDEAGKAVYSGSLEYG